VSGLAGHGPARGSRCRSVHAANWRSGGEHSQTISKTCRFESVTAHQRPQLCVSRLFAELPRQSNKILGVNHCIIEQTASADVDRALAVMVEQLNPEKEIAGRKAMRRLIQADLIWPIAYKRRRYRFVPVLEGQSELHVRPKQFRFKIRSVA